MKIGPFEILNTIGGGTNGIVYRAVRETLPDRVVALKQLRQYAQEGDREFARFHREAKLMSAIRSDHVVQLFTYEVVEGTPLLEMEYLEGGGLQAVMRDGPLPVGAALQVARDILTGLQALHEKGIYHRDIKPANVLQDEQGRFKIGDLGVSVGYAEAGDTVVAGTVKYVAPECMHRPPRFDERSDLYSTGMVIYEAILGADGFNEAFPDLTPIDVLGAKWLEWLANPNAEPKPLHVLRPEVPLPVSQFVARLLVKDPDRRFASAALGLEAIEPLLHLDPGEAEEVRERLRSKARAQEHMAVLPADPTIRNIPTPVDPSKKKPASRQYAAMAGGFVVLAVAAVALGAYVRPTTASRPSTRQPGRAVAGEPAGRVNARILNTQEEPIASAALRLRPGNIDGVSGEDGTAVFDRLRPGSYELTSIRDGYRIDVHRVEVKADETSAATVRLVALLDKVPHVDVVPPVVEPQVDNQPPVIGPKSVDKDPTPRGGPSPAQQTQTGPGTSVTVVSAATSTDLSKLLAQAVADRVKQRGVRTGRVRVSLEVSNRPAPFATQSISGDYVARVSTDRGAETFDGTVLGFSELTVRTDIIQRAANEIVDYLSSISVR
jgi:hypothetical protein